MKEEMEMQKQRAANSHRWWFESHNNPRSSLWLQSTLTELDEKTKAMLALIEPDADSFAGRAEMYYKKRPELISMVEDFYRAHRSLAERFDQIRQHDHGHRTFSIQKVRSPKAFDPYKYHDSYTEEAYCSESSNESEVDDPVQEDPEPVITPINTRKEQLSSKVGCDETSRLVQEINALREQNKLQRDQFMEKERVMEELMWQLSKTNDELMSLGEEFEKLTKVGMQQDKRENITWNDSLMPKDQDKISCDELSELRTEIKALKEDIESQNGLLMQKDEEKRSLMWQLSQANDELIRLGEEFEKLKKVEVQQDTPGNTTCNDPLMPEDQDKSGVSFDELFELKKEIKALKEDRESQNDLLKQKDEEKRGLMSQLSRNNEELSRLGEELEKLKKVGTKEWIPQEEVQQDRPENIAWKDPLMQKDVEKAEIELSEVREEIKTLKEDKEYQNHLLMQKDEEKREAIRQLSMAVEMLREENVLLKTYMRRESSNKKRNSTQISKFKGGWGRLFGSTPWSQTSVVPL